MKFIYGRDYPGNPFLSSRHPDSAVSVEINPFDSSQIVVRVDIAVDTIPEGLVVFAFTVRAEIVRIDKDISLAPGRFRPNPFIGVDQLCNHPIILMSVFIPGQVPLLFLELQGHMVFICVYEQEPWCPFFYKRFVFRRELQPMNLILYSLLADTVQNACIITTTSI